MSSTPDAIPRLFRWNFVPKVAYCVATFTDLCSLNVKKELLLTAKQAFWTTTSSFWSIFPPTDFLKAPNQCNVVLQCLRLNFEFKTTENTVHHFICVLSNVQHVDHTIWLFWVIKRSFTQPVVTWTLSITSTQNCCLAMPSRHAATRLWKPVTRTNFIKRDLVRIRSPICQGFFFQFYLSHVPDHCRLLSLLSLPQSQAKSGTALGQMSGKSGSLTNITLQRKSFQPVWLKKTGLWVPTTNCFQKLAKQHLESAFDQVLRFSAVIFCLHRNKSL